MLSVQNVTLLSPIHLFFHILYTAHYSTVCLIIMRHLLHHSHHIVSTVCCIFLHCLAVSCM